MPKHFSKIIVTLATVMLIFFFYKKYLVNLSISDNIKDNKEEIALDIPQDFVDFYNNFHSDSIYQLEHINFPLHGYAHISDTIMDLQPYIWELEDWKIHKPFDDHDGTFKREIIFKDGFVHEYLFSTNGLFLLEKKYTKIRKKWQLVYYQELAMVNEK